MLLKLDADVQAVLDRAPAEATVLDVLQREYLDYREPLQVAWKWNRTGQERDLQFAQQLLAPLAKNHPNAPRIWYELALSLVKSRQPALAVKLLEQKVHPHFGGRLDTDTFALWGRCHKDQGDEHKRRGEFAFAEQEYAKAESRYEDAYRVSSRDRFPGINVATLRLLQAAMRKRWVQEVSTALDRDELATHEAYATRLILASQQRATEVLTSRPLWQPKLADDTIWMAATEAEAYFLQSRWVESEQMFRTALRPDHQPQPHHFESISRQLTRLAEAVADLGRPVPPPFDDPTTFFASLPRP